MRTATYIEKLTNAGADPKVAQAHGAALEQAIADDYITRDYLDAKIAELEAKIDGRIGELDGKIGKLETKIDSRFGALDAKIDAKIADLRSESFKFMIGQIIAFTAIVFALLRFMK